MRHRGFAYGRSADVTLYHDGPHMISRSAFRGTDVTCDIGFHGDLNETYAVGEIDDDSKTLIRTCRESLDAAIKICKPGTLFRDIGKAMWVLSTADVIMLAEIWLHSASQSRDPMAVLL